MTRYLRVILSHRNLQLKLLEMPIYWNYFQTISCLTFTKTYIIHGGNQLVMNPHQNTNVCVILYFLLKQSMQLIKSLLYLMHYVGNKSPCALSVSIYYLAFFLCVSCRDLLSQCKSQLTQLHRLMFRSFAVFSGGTVK